MKSDPWLSAYGDPYDPRPAIEAWRAGEVEHAPKELWEHLYHQGAINSASYAAVSQIVKMISEQQAADWNAYALVATIEEARLSGENPAVPSELKQSYSDAWANPLIGVT